MLRRGGPLASELGGDLPCVRCRYNLRGLSIRGVCPECATPIKATLLAVVDPLASELRPIANPQLVGAGVMVWSTCGLMAVVAGWGAPIAEHFWERMGGVERWLALATCVLTGLSGLGAVVLVRPHAGISVRSRALAMVAIAMYVPLCMFLWRMYVLGDPRPGVRLGAHAVLIAILLGLRPNARLLAARSFLMRTGRIDRQTMLALAGVLCVSVAGNIVRVLVSNLDTDFADSVRQVGGVMVLVGMLLFTLGMFGVVLDCWRLRPVIVERPLSLEQVLGEKGATLPRMEQTG